MSNKECKARLFWVYIGLNTLWKYMLEASSLLVMSETTDCYWIIRVCLVTCSYWKRFRYVYIVFVAVWSSPSLDICHFFLALKINISTKNKSYEKHVFWYLHFTIFKHITIFSKAVYKQISHEYVMIKT